nr:zinc finger, CCHC-type, retrotransposon Gag domain protein [Tanacetum cinerariifolium]
MSMRHTWKKKLNHYNSSNEVDVNLLTPMRKPQSPINEPTTHSNHVSLQSHSLLLSDSCDTNIRQASIPPSINQSQTQTPFPYLLINPHVASVLHAQTSLSPQAMHLSQRNNSSSPYSLNLPHIINLDQIEQHVAVVARNIELLHESENSNKQDRDGNRVQNKGHGQQEIRGRYDQGQHVYRGRQDQSVEYRGRQDRGSSGQMRSTEIYLLHLFVLPVESLTRVSPTTSEMVLDLQVVVVVMLYPMDSCLDQKMVTIRNNPNENVPNFEAMINVVVANALPNLTAALRTQITNDIRNGVGPSGSGGGDAIPYGFMFRSKAHLRTQIGGDTFADTCTWVAFREIFYNRYFPASEQQRYEREYGSICQLDRENSGEYMERFTRLASFVGAVAGDAQRQARHFKWGLKKWVLDQIVNTDYTNVTQVAAAAYNIELLHESGNSNKRDRDGNRVQNRGHGQQEIRVRYDQGQHMYRGRQDQSVENQSTWDFNQGHASGSSGQRRSTETLPPPPLCATYGKPHPGVCYKATRGCFTCGSTQHKVKDCPQGMQKQSMSTDLARLPPTTGRVYATTRGQRRSTETLPLPPLCATYGKPHPGVCYKATGGCFTCGSTQHKVKDCPQGKQKQSMSTDLARLPPTTGRVYATTRGQAAKTSGTIADILCIDDRTVFALFDTGATHSIISTTFAKKLNMTPTPLIERIIISTPMKNHTLIDHEYVNCPLRFDDRIRPANLLPIHMFDFVVILGMDWLASHRATIDCYARTVIFGNVCQPEFVYHGSSPLKSVKLISAMKARTLISHGCQGFLASVMDTSLESPN